jgi:DMSO reductase family type II enzyme chaperone
MAAEKLSAITRGREIDLVLCRATLYSAIALGFGTPSEEVISRLARSENAAALTDAAVLLDAAQESELVCSVAAACEAAKTGSQCLLSRHRALFGHTARGTVPPYETEYGHEALFQQPQELSDLMGFYNAFGLTLQHGQHERPDHISCECEFQSFLALKEAYALEHQDPHMLAETRKAQKLFLRDHLARFVPAFAARVRQHDADGFYGKLARFLLPFVAAESRRLDVSLGAMDLSLRPADDDRVPVACGAGTECAAMPGACAGEEAESYD